MYYTRSVSRVHARAHVLVEVPQAELLVSPSYSVLAFRVTLN